MTAVMLMITPVVSALSLCFYLGCVRISIPTPKATSSALRSTSEGRIQRKSRTMAGTSSGNARPRRLVRMKASTRTIRRIDAPTFPDADLLMLRRTLFACYSCIERERGGREGKRGRRRRRRSMITPITMTMTMAAVVMMVMTTTMTTMGFPGAHVSSARSP